LDQDGDSTTSEVMKSSLPIGTFGSVVSLSAATYYQWYRNWRHRLWNTVSYICKSCCYVATFKCNLQWEKWDNLSCRNISIFLEIINM